MSKSKKFFCRMFLCLLLLTTFHDGAFAKPQTQKQKKENKIRKKVQRAKAPAAPKAPVYLKYPEEIDFKKFPKQCQTEIGKIFREDLDVTGTNQYVPRNPDVNPDAPDMNRFIDTLLNPNPEDGSTVIMTPQRVSLYDDLFHENERGVFLAESLTNASIFQVAKPKRYRSLEEYFLKKYVNPVCETTPAACIDSDSALVFPYVRLIMGWNDQGHLVITEEGGRFEFEADLMQYKDITQDALLESNTMASQQLPIKHAIDNGNSPLYRHSMHFVKSLTREYLYRTNPEKPTEAKGCYLVSVKVGFQHIDVEQQQGEDGKYSDTDNIEPISYGHYGITPALCGTDRIRDIKVGGGYRRRLYNLNHTKMELSTDLQGLRNYYSHLANLCETYENTIQETVRLFKL